MIKLNSQISVSLVVAIARNNGIGKDGKLPWHLPNDMKHFKNVTWAMPVIMGRKTFESLTKPLPGRKNIVLSRQSGLKADGAIVVKTIEDALFVASQTDAKEAMVIGGGEIYRSVFDRAKKIYLTRVEGEPEADTFFPEIDSSVWWLSSRRHQEADDRNAFAHTFETWEKL
jgi:dihydrofolate reductase